MAIDIRNLRKSYFQGGQKLEILKGLELHVSDGEVVAIVGQSGSGKSSLLAILAGLDRPDARSVAQLASTQSKQPANANDPSEFSGEVKISNQELTGLSEEELTRFRAQNIGIVFQQFHLIQNLTALENVMLPLEIAGDVRSSDGATPEVAAREILQQMGLRDRIHHLPSQLSGGECQRVAIARALVIQPKLLLADEPSGNLDSQTGALVTDVLLKMVKKFKITTVLVTHNEELANRCDRKLHLQNGVL